MASKTKLDELVAQEIKKYEGILVPIKASFAERVCVRTVPCAKLHPNPEDEFCFPEIGPNYQIINDYMRTYQRYGTMRPNELVQDTLTVEKTHPDGYMILNGHHRWAAFLQLGVKKVPVSIVNLTHETDIENMLNDSEHDKRVTLDLDEVVFCREEDTPMEKELPFPFNRLYKERIRLGIPALLNYLGKQGYDIWVYTADYYSYEYLRAYFKKYSVKVDGIITGTRRKEKGAKEARKRTEQRFRAKYKETIHIDRNMVLRTFRDTKEHEEFEIDAKMEDWSREVLKYIKGQIQNEKEK